MKYHIALSALLMMLITIACQNKSKHINVPADVLTAFQEKYPMAKNVQWEKEGDQEWEVEYRVDGQKFSSNFSTSGQWLETEYKLHKSKIPANILATLQTRFDKYEIEKREIVETNQGRFYEFTIEQDDIEFEVLIDTNGEILEENIIEDYDK